MVACFFSEPVQQKFPYFTFIALIFPLLFCGSSLVLAQESPFIVTYNHYLEEPGSLEVAYSSTFGTQRGGGDFHAFWAEFEYGATAWWTTECVGSYMFCRSTILEQFKFSGIMRRLSIAYNPAAGSREVSWAENSLPS